jgi:hypothetical protein
VDGIRGADAGHWYRPGVAEISVSHVARIAADREHAKPPALGAYGLAIDGLPDATRWMAPVGPAARLCVTVSGATPGAPSESVVDGVHADLRLLGGGRLRMRRGDGRAEFSFPCRPTQADLLHPYLAPAAALTQIWAGAEALHAGAWAVPAGGVLLLGEKEAGKSTTLARLATEYGRPVLADDLAVLSDGCVLPGPRCLDLRDSAGLRRAPTGPAVRDGERWRLSLAPVTGPLPLVAVVILRWGEAVALRTVPPRDRVGELLRQRMYAALVAADLAALLDLAAQPMLALTRPRGHDGLRAAAAALESYFA